MSLSELVDNNLTDKNTTHSYLDLYETLLSSKKDTAKNVLEIGLGDSQDKNGGSLKLWKNYFKNATIYGVDILGSDRVIEELKNDPRVILFTNTDGYDYNFVNKQLLEKNIKFDFMLDDGPHTLESMLKFIIFYSNVMADDGLLVIENVQDPSWFNILYQVVPHNLKKYVKAYDLRKNKNRYDDLVFTIDKRDVNNQYKYDFVVGAVFKNEAHILKEWVNHYRYHNVDHIYLINDGSTDNFETVLAPYIESGYVTLLHQTKNIDTFPRQKVIYNDLFRPLLNESKWWAIIDLDEFLYAPNEIDIKKIVNMYNNNTAVVQIHVPWVMFGSSGHIDQPEFVVPNFLYCKNDDQTPPNIYNGKSIFRSDKFIDFDVHFHKVDGKSVHDTNMLINHYAIQSWKFFERVKMTRGDVNLFAQRVGIVRDRSYFNKYDYKDKIDDRLARQNESIK